MFPPRALGRSSLSKYLLNKSLEALKFRGKIVPEIWAIDCKNVAVLLIRWQSWDKMWQAASNLTIFSRQIYLTFGQKTGVHFSTCCNLKAFGSCFLDTLNLESWKPRSTPESVRPGERQAKLVVRDDKWWRIEMQGAYLMVFTTLFLL